ncbi:fumarylacetoacetate hydrolase family protein [Pelagibius sp.]|uniref:fumarylacetoacetate hydrolase family protein n=1 Tax=Pelagibius sp. TaxID=1931238 RepID=UPI003BB05E93
MRLASYRYNGRDSFGVVTERGIVDVQQEKDKQFSTLQTALRASALDALREELQGMQPTLTIDEVELAPVVPDAKKVFCVGLNYLSHIIETKQKTPTYPMLFTRFANSHVGHDGEIILPAASHMFDFEGELAVVIGKRCRHVKASNALEVIAGYSCYNDGSVRDWQRHTSQFTHGNNFYHSGAFGPWLVAPDEIPDPTRLTLITRLNGKEMQRATTDNLLFDVPTLTEYITTFTELEPGDVVATGTTGGVGFRHDPQVFMREGDVVEVEISGIGILRNRVVRE